MKTSKSMNINTSTGMKLLAGGLLVFLAADLQGQLIYKTKFSAVEGYTNGWAIGQPSLGNKWLNANADFDWVAANEPGYGPLNDGRGYIRPDGSTFYNVTATNCTAPGGGQMMIAADNNQGINPDGSTRSTYFFKMDFPTQRRGPITVTWDWSFQHTNEIPNSPLPYSPTNVVDVSSNYNNQLPGFDHGFTFSDWANRTADGLTGNPNFKYAELSTPCRLSSYQDARYNGIGACGGGGNWNDYGPEIKDRKTLHMQLTVYVTNAPAEYMNSYEIFAQRDGEAVWQTAFKQDTVVNFWKAGTDGLYDYTKAASGMRRCAGETDPTSGINCLMLWLNGQVEPKYALVSNIRVVGPDPVAVPTVSIDKTGMVTFTGWLEAADDPQGPYTTVAVQSPYLTSASGKKFYRASN